MPITEHLFAFDQLTAEELGVLKTFERRLATIYPLRQHVDKLVKTLEQCKAHPEMRTQAVNALKPIEQDVLAAFANLDFEGFTEEKQTLELEAQKQKLLFEQLKRDQAMGGEQHLAACKKITRIVELKQRELQQIGIAETTLEQLHDTVAWFKQNIIHERSIISQMESLLKETQAYQQNQLDRIMLQWRQLADDTEQTLRQEKLEVYDKLQKFLHEKTLAERLAQKYRQLPKRFGIFKKKITAKDIEKDITLLSPADFTHYQSELYALGKEGYLTNDAEKYLRETAPIKAEEQRIALAKVTHNANYDQRTGMLRANIFQEQAKALIEDYYRSERPLSLLIIDIDKFKSINDELGHQAGDTALTAVATIIRKTIRNADLECRWGGEEMMVIAPNTDKEGAIALAEKIRIAIQKQTGAGTYGAPRMITVSIGISSLREDGYTFQELYSSADKCVYKAKDSGRNKVVAMETVKPLGRQDPEERQAA